MEIVITGKQLATYLAVGVPALVAIFAGAYKLGLDVNSANLKHKEDIIKEYQRSSQLDAPNLVSSLSQSAEALTLASHERKSFDLARKRVDQYAEKIGAYENDLSEKNDEITRLNQLVGTKDAQYQNQVNKLKAELEQYLASASELTVKRGIATQLVPNEVMLGVKSVYPSRAVFNVQGRDVYLSVGDSHRVEAKSVTCEFWLMRVSSSDDEAEIKLVCER